MQRGIYLLGVLFLAALPIAAPRAQQNPPPPAKEAPPQKAPGQSTIIRRVDLVDVIFSVLDRRQKFVVNLDKPNFTVLEDGHAEDIKFFSRETDLPLRIGLLLDTSNSIRERFQFEKEAAIDFLFSVLRRRKDQAFLMTFDNEPAVIQDYTEDLDKLRNSIQHERAGGGTALYDAIYFAAAERLLNPPLPSKENPDIRRVLVVISDGEDTLSRRSRGEAIEMAQRAGIVVYAISTSTEWVSAREESDPTKRVDRKYHKGEGDKVLEQFADETGGRAFFPYSNDDLNASFQDIGDELRSQYSLAYTPSNRNFDGKFRKIQIQVDRKGLTVRSRRGYYSPRPDEISSNPASQPQSPR